MLPVLLILIATVLRFYRIGASGLWVDEIFTAQFAAPDRSLAEVAAGPLATPLPAPPLWFWITHGSLRIHAYLEQSGILATFGDPVIIRDFFVRLPSVIAGVLGVWMAYRVGKLLFNPMVGCIAALFLALSPRHISHSQEARFYAGVVFFSLWSLYCLWKGLHSVSKMKDRKPDAGSQRSGLVRWLPWIGFTVATLVNCYIHLTAFLVLAAECVYAGICLLEHWFTHHGSQRLSKRESSSPTLREPDKKPGLMRGMRSSASLLPAPYRALLISLLIIGFAYLPMVFPVLNGLRGERGLGNPDTVDNLDLSIHGLLQIFGDFGAGFGLAFPLYMAAGVWGVAVTLKNHRQKGLLLLCWMGIPFLAILLLRPKHWFAPKYVISILPIYLFAVALGVIDLAHSLTQTLLQWRWLTRQPWLKALPGVILAILLLLYGVVTGVDLAPVYAGDLYTWLRLAQFFEKTLNTEDAVLLLPMPAVMTMPVYDIVCYYGPCNDQAILTLGTAQFNDATQIRTALRDYAHIWIVVHDKADPDLYEALLTALEPQAYVEFHIDPRVRLLYTTYGTSRQTLLDESAVFTSGNALAQASLAEAYLSLMQWDAAQQAYDQALVLDPEKLMWQVYTQAVHYESQGLTDEALVLHTKLVNELAEYVDVHVTFGDFCQRNNLTEIAVAAYSKAIELELAYAREDSVKTRDLAHRIAELSDEK